MPLIRKPADASRPAEAKPAIEMRDGLTSSNSDVRWAAARMAADDPAAATTLAVALRTETDPRVREAMFTSLARIGSADSTEAILNFLRSDEAALRAGAMDALRSETEVIRTHLPALLSDSDSDVRLLSCELARSLPGDEATRILSDLLSRERESNVCAAAIDVLAEAGGPEALEVLSQCEVRFRDTAFLTFAIKIAQERIQSQSTRHG